MNDKAIILVVDAVIMSEKGEVVLIKRAIEPYKGMWVLPGGKVEYGEQCEEAVVREVGEETGLDVEIVRLIGVYSDPGRDPRGHWVSVAYEVRATSGHLRSSSESTEERYFSLDDLPPSMGFDHKKVLHDFRAMNQA